jgi:UDP-N-acetylglucosamine 2-epimerase (non-hydrolysing)
MKLMNIVGARPNFMKIASIIDAINRYNDSVDNPKFKIQHLLVHTGQHYDDPMSDSFFRDLKLPKPDIDLGVGSASHAVQTSEIMKRFEPVLLEHQPDVVILVGDVNSTVACALVASKIVYPNNSLTHSPNNSISHSLINSGKKKPLIAHVEAGLRSFDRTMPEEINRLLTDAISDFLFTTEESANENLRKEGIPQNKIFFVGNTMIDTLLKHREKAQESKILEELGLITSQLKTQNSNLIPYGILTLHRPSNVDNKEDFLNIIDSIKEVAKRIPVIFPAHPRTVNRIKEFHFEKYFNFVSQDSLLKIKNDHINCLEPLGYLDFLCLMSHAKLVLTDSGGIQEETTILGIPCVTLRQNTERPITTTEGTNVVVGTDKGRIFGESIKALDGNRSNKKIPPLWDGKAGERIISILTEKDLNQE